jgi:hypothetical protein
MRNVVGVVIAVACLWFPVAYVLGMERVGRKGGVKDRLGIIDGFAGAIIGIVLARLLIPWHVVPALLWAVPVAFAAYGTALAVRAWPTLPWVTGRAAAARVAGTAIGVAVTALIAVASA